MPRKSNGHFGESASSGSSFVRMSNEALLLTHLKNSHERWRYLNVVKHLTSNEKLARHHQEREYEIIKDDYIKMLAYGSVYRKYSFENYDPHHVNGSMPQNNGLDGESEVPELPEVRNSVMSVTKLPSITERSSQSEQPLLRKQTSKSKLRTNSEQSAVNRSLDCENEFSKIPDDIFEENEVFEEEEEDEKSARSAMTTILAMNLSALAMWKHNDSSICARLKSPEKSKTSNLNKRRSEVAMTTPVKSHTLFPGDCRSTYALKKFLEKEACDKMSVLSKPRQNPRKMQKLIEKAKFPVLINSHKPTSAIFRDFQVYKDSLEASRPCD